MKELNVTWENGVTDPTGYLFSFAKALGTAVKSSRYAEAAEDIIATSGFAFRMWIDKKGLCPSAMSIWDFESQKRWVEQGGLTCNYVGRYLEQDNIRDRKRQEAITIIKASIDDGIPAISWNIGGCEWGLITGYDDEKEMFRTLSITGVKIDLPYGMLGEGEIPILSVLTITGSAEKSQRELLQCTLKLAAAHLIGEEVCENITGLEAYPAFLHFFEEGFDISLDWNIEYYLGTYGGLKYYAYQYFRKNGLEELCKLYQTVYYNWKAAFDLKMAVDISIETIRKNIRDMLVEAYEAERTALMIMKNQGGKD